MHHNLSWIKSYLCTTMTNERLNGLALLSVYNYYFIAIYTNNSRTEGRIFEEETLFNGINYNTALTFYTLHLHTISITDKYS